VFDSVRVRLTLWYTAVLACVLVVLAFATYFILRRDSLQRSDSSLAELGSAFLVTVNAELQDAPGNIHAASEAAIAEHKFRDVVFFILDDQDQVVAASASPLAATVWPGVPSQLMHTVVSPSESTRPFQTIRTNGHIFRSYARVFSAGEGNYGLVVLQSLHRELEFLESVSATFAVVIPVFILLASGGGYFLARRSLSPVVAMSTQAGHMSAANLQERLPIRNERDELGHLARAFNDLLDRRDQALERQRRFIADASHELRTPVAILCGEAEVALSQTVRSSDEYRESLQVLSAESRRIKSIVEDLFTLARADAGQYPLTLSVFYLDELAADCVRTVRTLAQAKGISLQCDGPTEMPIRGDEALIRRLLLNVLDNAIKFTSQGGAVTVVGRPSPTGHTLSISDSGPGIPDDVRARIFERFFRADKARSRADGENAGAGLGLSIGRWIAESHNGRLELTRSEPGTTTFTIWLPAYDAVSPANR
jgi:two-component system, OmpR family, sensor kinase